VTAQARDVIEDPREFITRLKILTKRNQYRYFHPLWEETDRFLTAILSPSRYVLGVKPRQVAFTTCVTAYEFWKGYTSPGAHRCVQVVHERDAMRRLGEMVSLFHDGLPQSMQRGLSLHNEKLTRYAHNKAGFNRVLAGGRGQARSWAFNDAHFTEMAFYPSATAASVKDAAGSTAEGMWQSAIATLDDSDPDQKIIIESTGNGPRGLFYKLWKQARDDPEWAYVFVPWSSVQRYRWTLTQEQEDRFLETLTPDEEELHGPPNHLTAGQLAWRRNKMETEQWTLGRFKREYPLTDLEPFMAAVSGWFDQYALSRLMEWQQHPLARDRAEIRVFHDYEPGRRYFMGADTSGGVGRDYASIQVIRDDLLHVATWYSNTSHPRRIATEIARLGDRFGGRYGDPPMCLVEANHHGQHVIARLRAMGEGRGVRLWRSPDSDEDFWSTPDRKREVMLWARELVEDSRTIVECAWTVMQMQGIVEKWNGKIEAANDDAMEVEDKDDMALAYCLALFAARKHVSPKNLDSLERERARVSAVVRSRFG
jgi:hypothetical protein